MEIRRWCRVLLKLLLPLIAYYFLSSLNNPFLLIIVSSHTNFRRLSSSVVALDDFRCSLLLKSSQAFKLNITNPTETLKRSTYNHWPFLLLDLRCGLQWKHSNTVIIYKCGGDGAECDNSKRISLMDNVSIVFCSAIYFKLSTWLCLNLSAHFDQKEELSIRPIFLKSVLNSSRKASVTLL